MLAPIPTMRRLLTLLEDTPLLYHATSADNAQAIRHGGFQASVSGELGPGVYVISDPSGLSAARFEGLTILRVRVGVPMLSVAVGANLVLDILRALLGRQRGTACYDATPNSVKFSRYGQTNWPWLHGLLQTHGFGGITLAQTGSAKNTVVFNPQDVQPQP